MRSGSTEVEPGNQNDREQHLTNGGRHICLRTQWIIISRENRVEKTYPNPATTLPTWPSVLAAPGRTSLSE
ncbi:Hypp2032 [Branchiostoma lanceolatum]|uniref:Hypp2032 protein n=1 Tax=Branchiostoma lanceolatum TaxID=7740 RepID=A0A8J9ZN74_BRALA|nr:Hypp2032 [Branchiostoma lanceolatum]